MEYTIVVKDHNILVKFRQKKDIVRIQLEINCIMPITFMAPVPEKMAGRHPRYRGHCVPCGHSTVKQHV